MAFDQATRNRLQRFVNDARRVLEEEFTRQPQNDYGMDPNAGSVAELASLRHINDAQRESARILRDTLAHYTASGDMDAKQGLDRIVREQSFTVLNRLAALRMAEARGLLVESVGNGFQAKGFQLYARLAGTGLGETGDAYRTYLFSVFDELSQDLPGLFDRYSPQGRLFPREAALLQVLNQINDADIAPLWSEDETIGWIYQYFNSKEERKAMRDASQVPRNSRELAVRNQFFTPRYVVEFLVDNTLGRLWFNATGGATGLRERCQYLLVKPDESPQAAAKLRDPRTLKLLDPACGSMHFGLYACDLFAEIYREAWAWEQQHGPGSLDVSTQPQAALKPLSQTYEDEAAFLSDVPRLIIEHNIYGVDIDPRAAQIASLALWLRAQRAWQDAGVKAKDRPLIGRGHVVAAIAPPAERELRQQFAANLDQRDAELFEKTLQLLKGLPELGVLLQVERELPHLIRQVYVGKGTGLFAQQEQESWQQAEARLRVELTEFAQAAKSTYQGRLFAQDALQGLRVIDLCREVFDVVVMNPPFGEVGTLVANYCDKHYHSWNKNILCAFAKRATELSRNGLIGCVIDRSLVNKSTYDAFREDVFLNERSLEIVLDLGWGVLDGANVEVSSFVLNRGLAASEEHLSKFLDLRPHDLESKETELLSLVRNAAYPAFATSVFSKIPNNALAYDLPEGMVEIFRDNRSISDQGFNAYTGHQLQSERHFFLHWEIPQESLDGGKFEYLYNGGEYSRYVSSPKEVCLFGYFAHLSGCDVVGYTFVLRNKSQHLKKGIYFGVRGEYLDAHFVGPGRIFTVEGQAIPCESYDDALLVLAYLNSALASRILNTYSGQHKYSGYVNLLPLPMINQQEKRELVCRTEEIIRLKLKWFSFDETGILFVKPLWMNFEAAAVSVDVLRELIESDQKKIDQLHEEIEGRLISAFNLEGTGAEVDIRAYSKGSQDDKSLLKEVTNGFCLSEYLMGDVLSFFMGCRFERWRYDQVEGRNSEIDPKKYFDTNLGALVIRPSIGGVDVLESEVICELDDLSGQNSKISDFLDWLHISKDVLHKSVGGDGFFFEYHLKKYQSGRRYAPIYWPLSTTSGGYTLWVYYPNLTSQTLYTAINDFVEPKLQQVGADVTALRNKGAARTREDEKQFESLQAFELELIDLRDILHQLAPTYRPIHDDGVQISAAPLWPLFRHKPWQKVLKDTWAKLEKGDCDWAHLAMNYWPERVREKCKTDKSLAIAHGLEDLYLEPEAKPKKARGKNKAGGDE